MQGLLFDRLNKQKTGKSVITERISRISIGVVCDMKYDANIHVGQPVYIDNVDRQKYAQGQISWMIQKVNTSEDDTRIRQKSEALLLSLAGETQVLTQVGVLC